ncbi:unnamed protein product, partial [Mycena citricolor]
ATHLLGQSRAGRHVPTCRISSVKPEIVPICVASRPRSLAPHVNRLTLWLRAHYRQHSAVLVLPDTELTPFLSPSQLIVSPPSCRLNSLPPATSTTHRLCAFAL